MLRIGSIGIEWHGRFDFGIRPFGVLVLVVLPLVSIVIFEKPE